MSGEDDANERKRTSQRWRSIMESQRKRQRLETTQPRHSRQTRWQRAKSDLALPRSRIEHFTFERRSLKEPVMRPRSGSDLASHRQTLRSHYLTDLMRWQTQNYIEQRRREDEEERQYIQSMRNKLDKEFRIFHPDLDTMGPDNISEGANLMGQTLAEKNRLAAQKLRKEAAEERKSKAYREEMIRKANLKYKYLRPRHGYGPQMPLLPQDYRGQLQRPLRRTVSESDLSAAGPILPQPMRPRSESMLDITDEDRRLYSAGKWTPAMKQRRVYHAPIRLQETRNRNLMRRYASQSYNPQEREQRRRNVQSRAVLPLADNYGPQTHMNLWSVPEDPEPGIFSFHHVRKTIQRHCEIM